MAGKTIRVTSTYEEEPQEWRDFSLDIAERLTDLPGVSSELASAIIIYTHYPVHLQHG